MGQGGSERRKWIWERLRRRRRWESEDKGMVGEPREINRVFSVHTSGSESWRGVHSEPIS